MPVTVTSVVAQGQSRTHRASIPLRLTATEVITPTESGVDRGIDSEPQLDVAFPDPGRDETGLSANINVGRKQYENRNSASGVGRQFRYKERRTTL